MAEKLEMSPQDKHKAKYGEQNQASYLIMAKENSATKKASRQLYEDREIREEKDKKLPFKNR